MDFSKFRVQMYKCIRDSGWISVPGLAVIVGKNEAGKTSLLKCLHKFNPYDSRPYEFATEWPRGYRRERDPNTVVCSVEFALSKDDRSALSDIADKKVKDKKVVVHKDYDGNFEVDFESDIFPDRLHPNEVDEICGALPDPTKPVGAEFQKVATNIHQAILNMAKEGRYEALVSEIGTVSGQLNENRSANGSQEFNNENTYIGQLTPALQDIQKKLTDAPSIRQQAHNFIVTNMPTFIYMDDYRAFEGSALLDQVAERKKVKKATPQDETLLMLFALSGLDLDQEVERAKQNDKELRQYDLSDASATLTKAISDRWKQRRYEVEFRADGQSFYTFVKDDNDPSLIRLEERSKGFQWFFSFDLLFMHESGGTFQDCVLLLDEPGLHLHPEAQTDLLKRLAAYAESNALVYTTHLPFMIDIRHPEQIRIVNETADGSEVTDNIVMAQPEAKLVLQAALGIGGSTSYLLSDCNLVVEGVHDYWILSTISNALHRFGDTGLRHDLRITPAGGASEAVYIATLMVGQGLGTLGLFDGDAAGTQGRDDLVKKWLTMYNDAIADAMTLSQITDGKLVTIEDLLSPQYYAKAFAAVNARQLATAGLDESELSLAYPVESSVEAFCAKHDLKLNKGSVAKWIRDDLASTDKKDELNHKISNETREVTDPALK